MSAMPKYDPPITELDYFALLTEAEDAKYEFINGEIVMMVGASPNHQAITSDLNGLFYNATRGKPCRYFDSDTPVKVPAGNYYYPDITVVCGKPEYVEDAPIGILTNPALIIEVLSESTASKDRTTKFDSYRTLSTLRDYLLVWQDEPRIEMFTRGDNDTWILSGVTGLASSLALPSLDMTLALSEVYQRVSFETPDADSEETNVEN
jgi:Uma2 family endonuclease